MLRDVEDAGDEATPNGDTDGANALVDARRVKTAKAEIRFIFVSFMFLQIVRSANPE